MQGVTLGGTWSREERRRPSSEPLGRKAGLVKGLLQKRLALKKGFHKSWLVLKKGFPKPKGPAKGHPKTVQQLLKKKTAAPTDTTRFSRKNAVVLSWAQNPAASYELI